MKRYFKIFKNVWSYIKASLIETIKDVGEFFSNIWKHKINIIIACMYLIPIYITTHYFNIWCIIIVGIYLIIGTFFALFNDAGPYWLSYFLLYFWGPCLIINGLIIVPIYNIIRIFGIMKPRYTQEQINASKYFERVGREIIEKNKNKKNKNK